MAGIPSVLDLRTIDGSNGFTISISGYLELAGSSVASAGDVNGDGFADVIVGAPGQALAAFTDYAAFVIFGSGYEDTPGASRIDTGSLNPSDGFRIKLAGGQGGYDGPQSGFAVSSAGDFNGDGFGDLMVSAPSYSAGAEEQGASYIVFGKASGFTDVTLGTTTSSDWIRIDGAAAGDYSGHSVAALGDINGDGFDDVLIGSPYAEANGRWSAGISYVVYGSASGANIDLANVDASDGFRIIGDEFGSVGYSVSVAGDVNGDGIIDLLIGAPYDQAGGMYRAGSTYLVFGSISGADVDLANLTPSQGVRLDGGEVSESGSSVASAGDINGDGLADLIIGAPDASPDGREEAGSAFVIFGKTSSWSNIDLANLSAGDGFRIDGAVVGAHAGYSVSSAGDFNGDGYDDLIIGAPYADLAGGPDPGSAYVIFGKPAGFGDIDLTNLNAADGFRIDGPPGQLLGNLAGFAVASAGDVDADGYGDLVVGMPGSGYLNGTAYVVYGEASAGVNRAGTGGDDRLFGGDFDDTLSGGEGNDLIGGKDGNDVLTGGAGRDAFVYAHFGQQLDTITDFRQGEDVIDLRSTNIGTFATLQQLLSNDAQGNAVITSVRNGLTSTITLAGVSANELTSADFVFADDSADQQGVSGTSNADDLFGGAGRDTLQGNAGDDRLFGEQGSDSLEGGIGADLIDGGEGIDEATFRTAQAGVIVSLASGGTAGDAAGDIYISIEDLWGSNHDDFLEGNDQANSIWGLDGANVIRGLGGNDSLAGGNEGDTFYGGAGADEINGAGGFDYARYDDAPSGVTVGFGTGTGYAAGDRLLSIEGIVGSAFADSLGGSGAADDLQGGAGDDLLQGRVGDDTLDGGEGSDRAVFTGTRSQYFVSFDAATDTYIVRDLREGSPDGTDRVRNVEIFVFADGAIPAESVLDGNPGPIIGDDGDNILTGSSIGEEIRGLDGNDALSGLGGEDLLDGGDSDDTLDGGTGIDTATYASAGLGVAVSLAITGAQETGGAGNDTLVGIENLTGSAHDDKLFGNAAANVLSGLAGNDRFDAAGGADTLLGGDGDDILIGGAGGDVLDGGEGFDLVSYETATSVAPVINMLVINLSDPLDAWGDALSDTFLNIEGVIGSNNDDLIIGRSIDDALIGGAGNDIFFGHGGKDTFIGGEGADGFGGMSGVEHFDGGDGVDLVSYQHEWAFDITTGITVDFDDPFRNAGIAAGDTYAGIERLIGSILDDDLTGDATNNAINGSFGNDVVAGRDGDDTLEGDDGQDRLIGGAGADILNGNLFLLGEVFDGGDDFDIASYETAASGVIASLSNSAINTGDAAGDIYYLIEGLAGSALDDTLEGDEYDNALEGGAGNDTLIGRAGSDDFDGGAGNDTVVLFARRADSTITFDAASQTFMVDSPWGVNRIRAVETLQFSDGALSVASLIAGDDGDNSLNGTENADDVSGGGGNDTLFGRGGDDRVDGGAGDDVLHGGDGNDDLRGGTGRDTASYAQAAAAVRVDLGIGGAQATGGGGTDTLTDIEDLTGSAFDDTLIGSSAANRLSGGAGNDVLVGSTGDILDGAAGSDTVSYANAALWDLTVDLAISGVQTGGTLLNIENIIGSAGFDTLKGDVGANQLSGGAANDMLMGRGGDDVLDGGDGADTGSFAEASAGVTVDLALAGPQNTGEGVDTLISIENLTGSAFADTLKGTSGDNALRGGAGDDALVSLGGNDILDGGDGLDTVSFAGIATGVRVDLSVTGSQFIGGASQRLISIENVTGSAFADTLIGNGGANALNGGGGLDVLTGGLGRDTLTGGADRDVFDLNALAESVVGAGNRDVITDFQRGVDDIDLTGIDANTSRSGDQGFRFTGTQEFGGKAGELRYQTFDHAGTANDVTVISGDVNGDRIADFEIEIVGIVQLSSGDFLL